MESDVREVSFEEALAEENIDIDQSEAPARRRPPHAHSVDGDAAQHTQSIPQPFQEDSEAQRKQEEIKDDLETLAPPVESREWTFGEGDLERKYVQRELSVIGSAQWFRLLGDILDKTMSGDNALSLNSLLAPPTPREPGNFKIADFQDADMFVHALGKLLTVMPNFLEDSICIWLDVPDYERPLIRELMRRSPKIGGMSYDTFEEILATFIDQNYSEIDRFFRVRSQRLRARWQARAREASQSRSSKH